jgi:polysaccharide export outer membrane protein
MKRFFMWIAAILAVMGLSGCDSDYKLLQTKQPSVKNERIANRSIEYIIQPQDRLQIILYKDPNQESVAGSNELGQTMTSGGILVDSRGYITLPLIGKLKVAGLTQSQAAEKITRMYKKYLNTPSIYLEVINKRLFVLGEVNKPGPVKLDREKMTLLEAIAFAGDLKDSAVRNDIIILSNDPHGGMHMRHVDLTHFDKMTMANMMLRPNDIVYVKPDNWKEFRVNAANFTSPFEFITKIAAPFVTLKYLND